MAGDVLLIYASMTGNTRELAESVAKGLQAADLKVEMKEVYDASPAELLAYDNIILGTYTWGEGDLPDEFLDFFDDMGTIDLTGKHAAVFGCGDTSYEHFAVAGDILHERLAERGAVVWERTIKIDRVADKRELEECKQFGMAFAEQVLQIGGAR
ncbi:flavodoxin [Paenibacillus baekrokdamisoli]|uniref:Flavodoxin n=1 Tax=Paenibacillus baekrokdamisoli TaxID=1712516 RepID=A0A3G9IVS3_9BACL|nr:flavodoxin [Paenibacillus baekrokdamisoli]MBB3068022.1 flavodoxin I [Paenibacillus baekrokdamisoli]BBH22930.1 flavodoxin [Paenibacillus baekrokdamisoli]